MSAAVRSRTRLWADIWSLLKEFWAAHPLAMLGQLTLLLVGNARTALYLVAIGGIVDALSSGGMAGGRPALFWVSLYIVATFMEEFYWGAGVILRTYLRDHGVYRIQWRVLERAASAPLIQFEQGRFFEHLQRAVSGMGDRLVQLFGQLMDLGQMLVSLGGVAVALYLVHPAVVLLMLLGALPAIWLQARVATLVWRAEREHTGRDRVRAHLQGLLTGREAASELRLFGTGGYLLARWRDLREQRGVALRAAEQRRALFVSLGNLFAGGAYAAGLVLVAFLIMRGQLSVGNYATVAMGALWFQQMLSGLVQVGRSLEEQSHFLGDLFDFWQVAQSEAGEGEAASAHGAASLGRDHVSPVEHTAPRPSGQTVTESPIGQIVSVAPAATPIAVEAERLTFSYPGATAPVIQEIDLQIRPGERIAIVGENGAGKTTLVKLLMGLYQPDQGRVLLDGRAPAPEVRRRIAAVFQDFAGFQLTVRENIGFGDIARMGDDVALTVAAERAGLRDLSGGLDPDGYLGRQFGGRELSGGQWQRVALARAFFREADLLVLDEPTAALDPLAELALFERFIELVEGRTAIMISHRLGAARLADRVLVLAHGRIVESGSHEELLAQGGEYARLFAAQAQWYR